MLMFLYGNHKINNFEFVRVSNVLCFFFLNFLFRLKTTDVESDRISYNIIFSHTWQSRKQGDRCFIEQMEEEMVNSTRSCVWYTMCICCSFRRLFSYRGQVFENHWSCTFTSFRANQQVWSHWLMLWSPWFELYGWCWSVDSSSNWKIC